MNVVNIVGFGAKMTCGFGATKIIGTAARKVLPEATTITEKIVMEAGVIGLSGVATDFISDHVDRTIESVKQLGATVKTAVKANKTKVESQIEEAA